MNAAEKLRLATQMEKLGVDVLEAGFPAASEGDFDAVSKIASKLKKTEVAGLARTSKDDIDRAWGAVRHAAKPRIHTFLATSDIHMEYKLNMTRDQVLKTASESVKYAKSLTDSIEFSAEDASRSDRDFLCKVFEAAIEAGATTINIPDTVGYAIPMEFADLVKYVMDHTPNINKAVVSVHCHNDLGLATANTLAAVDAGATHIQGTLNGYGERTGNADLISVVANLEFKLGREIVPLESLREATRIAHAVAEVTNVPPSSRQPYVGVSAFTHKAGLHASAIKVDPDLYQHMDPALVGNDMRLLVSEMAGRASIELKGRELGFDLSNEPEMVARITSRVKDLESRGYTFEAADASFELLLIEEVEGGRPAYFDVESWRVITDSRPSGEALSEATIKLRAGGARIVTTGEGNGPVNALDHALREAIGQAYPEVEKFELIDYKVRIVDQSHGTDAVTRVLIETADGAGSWTTVGVGHNVIEASWGALTDAVMFGLRRHGQPPATPA